MQEIQTRTVNNNRATYEWRYIEITLKSKFRHQAHFVLLSADKAKKNDEQIDYINVQLQCPINMFLRTQLIATITASDYHLCIKHEELKSSHIQIE